MSKLYRVREAAADPRCPFSEYRLRLLIAQSRCPGVQVVHRFMVVLDALEEITREAAISAVKGGERLECK